MRELEEFDVKMEVDEWEILAKPARCRMCATEVNTGEPRSDTFAATPPLNVLRLVLSWEASYKPEREKRTSQSKSNAAMIIVVFDISVTFFHGKVRKTTTWCRRDTVARREIPGSCSRVFMEPAMRARCSRRTWRRDSAITASREARWCHACTGAQCWRRLECTAEPLHFRTYRRHGRRS